MRHLAVLVGNGLSIAFNPDLNLRTITTAMLERIQSATDDGSDVVAAMKEIAGRALPAGAESEDDFEVLVGAFGAESRTLGYLEQLAGLVSPQDDELKAAIKRVSNFAEEVRDTGLSHVLEVIFERSKASWDVAANLHALVTAITQQFDGKISIANLNYDSLLLSALLTVCQYEVADMASGVEKVKVTDRHGAMTLVPSLRKHNDFPIARRIRLLHLHGSVTYWSNKERTLFAKLKTEYLRDHDQWLAIRERKTNLRPVVVLANARDKSEHVKEHPFALAYDMFEDGLDRAKSWLIIGYSFKDEPVNQKLRNDFAERKAKPKVLVVTHGDLPTRLTVERAFGWAADDADSSEWLTINRSGANGLQDTDDWQEFTA